jgi:hypothetical protein
MSGGTFAGPRRSSGMVESLILLLIYIALVVGVAWLVIWVLGQLGVALPPPVVKVFWVIVTLVIILLLYRMISPSLLHGRLP